MPDRQNVQISPLTGLRFLAAAIVLIHHFARPRSETLTPVLTPFISHSFLGVTVFFVLSGFILSYTYGRGPNGIKGTKRDFWAARVARLYPVYLLGMLLFVPIFYYWHHDPQEIPLLKAVLSLLALQAWFHQLGLSWGMWNPPGWSLSAEAFFYLAFPFVCPPLSRLSTKSLWGFAFICWILSMLATLTYLGLGAADRNFWMFTPLVRLPEFMLGITAGLLWKNRRTQAFDKLAPYAGPLSCVVVAALMFLPVDEAFFYNGAIAPLAALLICSLACSQGWLARLLSCRPMVLLGGASYSLYIVHWPAWAAYTHYFDQSNLAQTRPGLFFIVYFVITVAASCICFKYLEEPMHRFLRKRLVQPPSDTVADELQAKGSTTNSAA